MKKLLAIAFLVIGMVAGAQTGIHFPTKEYFTVSISVDPHASLKEHGLNLIGELECVSSWKYAKFSMQGFPELEGGYLDVSGAFGVNITKGYFEKVRTYAGVRLGIITRGKEQYPLFGFESGFDVMLTDKVYIGISYTKDWRSDYIYTDGKPGFQDNGHVKFGTRF